MGDSTAAATTGASASVIRITHLFVPQQSGTSDSCESSEDSDVQVLDFALSSGLICVGWIHTHPSQSCFLSSIDLHTSLGYQVLCNEALAIVVAPTDHQYQPCGVFRLTEYGIAYLKTCHRRGFHKHSDAQMPLYEVVGSREWTLVSDAGVTIVDRRIG
ncbi:amsh, putative [Perkinsus marinus ATCC 50983]|uniref:Amsh, putative n=1 Tax=Perkinsus marinus (strain ATCC 50983 / TXsc) TaxID=423536 RepID=C5LBB3_PERM5|nr:amsh, putative [Perkinsus marinus ATCC 50983]EER06041.1 amsh, putative [Perkinsus marinus ATCC 50983]|eukprot:XP_002774225.1 amsh, putative [Perkinsus marinus ATCC 50983]